MSLTEIMSSAGLSRFAEWGLLLFVFAFVLIVVRIFRPSKRESLEAQANLPLEDESSSPPSSRNHGR